jgi:hypothetical protein
MSDCCSVHPKPGTAPMVMACPENGARAKQVETLTVRSLVRHLPSGMPATQYYFCGAPDCDVVYFAWDAQAPIFRRGDLLVSVGAKAKSDPIQVCYCFGFTRKDIEKEIADTGLSTVAERISEDVKRGNCACEIKNPSGKCCLGDVTRVVRDCLKGIR